MTGIFEDKIELSVPLELRFLSSAKIGIKRYLNHTLMKHSKAFGGIVLGYWNLKLLDDSANIDDLAQSSVQINVQATFLVFKFSKDSLLVGTVGKLGSDHISLVVANDINVSIRNECLGDWKYRSESSTFEDGKGGYIREGSLVVFKVNSMKCEHDFFFIEGEIQGVADASLPWIEKDLKKRKGEGNSKRMKKVKI